MTETTATEVEHFDLSYARCFPETCAREVERGGYAVPCEKPAVAVRIDDEGDGYPVCKHHTAGNLVPLSALLVRGMRDE